MKTMARQRKRMNMDDFVAKYIDTLKLTPEERREVDEFDAYLTVSLNISVALLEARKELNLTQQQLAVKLGLDQSEVSRLEGPECNPTLRTLSKLATALNLEIHLLPRQG